MSWEAGICICGLGKLHASGWMGSRLPKNVRLLRCAYHVSLRRTGKECSFLCVAQRNEPKSVAVKTGSLDSKPPLAYRGSAYGETALAKRLFTGTSRTRFAQTACRPVSVPKRSARHNTMGFKTLEPIIQKSRQPFV
jgi:hypothetical protein